jgi:hypothetical protein
MSASDAAPLPRLGEVFFDVRGSSRSMRLSWYSDTGVAVFSIWQGGMCTGTFRLPIGDLPRMIEILQQGPDGDHGRPRADHRAEQAWGGRELAGTGQRQVPSEDPGFTGAGGRYQDEPRTGYSHADIETSVASYPGDELARPREDRARPRRGGDYGPPGGAEYGRAGRPDYGPPGGGADYGPAAGADYRPPGGTDYSPSGSGPGYGPGDFGGERDRGYLPPAPPVPPAPAEPASDYSQERFVPPYVRGAVGEYGSDIPARPATRPEDPIRGAYRSDPLADPSHAEDYPRRPWPESGYSDGPQYRLADRGSRSSGSGQGRHSPGRHGNYPPEPDPADPEYQTGLPGDIDERTDDYPGWRQR